MESVKTTLRVLEAVVEASSIGVSELARRVGEPKTTVQRCLQTLHEAGYLKPSREGRRSWSPTAKLMLLSRQAYVEPRLREVALPTMRALRDRTGETIHLMVPEGGEVVLIERMDSLRPVRTVRQLGAHAPLHVASNGKAALAALPASEQEAYLRGPLNLWTERTIVDPVVLRREIDQIRERGYAASIGELDAEIHAVAAAILNADGYPVGTMSISCPSARLPADLVEPYGQLVRAAAAEISANLAR